jgi:hypothetical protein
LASLTRVMSAPSALPSMSVKGLFTVRPNIRLCCRVLLSLRQKLIAKGL